MRNEQLIKISGGPRPRIIFPDGTRVVTRRLGEGSFTRAYVEVAEKDHPVVFLATDVGNFDKEILTEINRETSSKHLPKVKHIGFTKNRKVYTSPLYSTAQSQPTGYLRKPGEPRRRRGVTGDWCGWPTVTSFGRPIKNAAGVSQLIIAGLVDEAPKNARWQYEVLKECLDEAEAAVHTGDAWWSRKSRYDGSRIMDGVVSCAKKKRMPRALVRALDLLRRRAADYSSAYTFEFGSENVAVDSKGNLILLDVIFNVEELAKKRGLRAVRRKLARGRR